MFLNENPPHNHAIVDSDVRFIINPTTRTITTDSAKVRVMQGDHNSERFTFEIPKTIEGHDMTSCNKVEVHFTNTDVKTKQESCGYTEVKDLQVSPDNDKVAIFSWLIKRTATKYEGTLKISVLFACVDETTGEEVYTWSTFPFSNISVAKGQRNNATADEETLDVLEQWRKELFELKPRLFLRYSASANGSGFTSTWQSGQKYLGLAVGTTAPTVASGYQWVLFKGEAGASPYIDPDTGHWMLNGVDLGWIAGKYDDGTIDPPDTPVDPDDPDTPDDPDDPDTPDAPLMYCGSIVNAGDNVYADYVKNNCTGVYGTYAESKYMKGHARFLIAIRDIFDVLKVHLSDDENPINNGYVPVGNNSETDYVVYKGNITIDNVNYKVYLWDRLDPRISNGTLTITVS